MLLQGVLTQQGHISVVLRNDPPGMVQTFDWGDPTIALLVMHGMDG